MKLKDCGIFGVSSQEYLSYAIRNRQEWEVKGEGLVAIMAEKAKTLWTSNAVPVNSFPALQDIDSAPQEEMSFEIEI
jgi:hypothetical protein